MYFFIIWNGICEFSNTSSSWEKEISVLLYFIENDVYTL